MAQALLQSRRAGVQGRAQTAGLKIRARSRQNGKRRAITTVNKNQAEPIEPKSERSDFLGRRESGRRRHRVQRQLQKRRNAGEAPFLVAGGWPALLGGMGEAILSALPEPNRLGGAGGGAENF